MSYPVRAKGFNQPKFSLPLWETKKYQNQKSGRDFIQNPLQTINAIRIDEFI
jgi:hypothetical protein